MHKKDLIAKVAEATEGATVAQTEAVINNFLSCLQTCVKDGEKVILTGFGTFESKTTAARKGRHPGTGAELQIPEKQRVTFKVGKVFKDFVQK